MTELMIEKIESDLDEVTFKYHQLLIRTSKKEGDVEGSVYDELKEYLMSITHKQNVLRKLNLEMVKDELTKMFESNKALLEKLESDNNL